MQNDIRNSGIAIVGNIPWGTHFCQFYKTKEELIEIVVPYFKAGLENNELCIWITSQSFELEDAKRTLEKDILDFNAFLKEGQVKLISHSDWFLKEGILSSERVLTEYLKMLNQALDNGYNGLRVVENTCWLGKEYWDYFADYQEKLDLLVNSHQMVVLHPYCLDALNGTETINLISSHKLALIKEKGKWKHIGDPIPKDGTEYKLAEEALDKVYEKIQAKSEKLKKANKAIREIEERLQIIVTNSPDVIFAQDCNLRYNWIYNPMPPFATSDVVGKTDADLFPEDQAQLLTSIKRRVLETGKREETILQLSSGGKYRWYEVIYEPSLNEAGKVIGLVSYSRDVTRRKKVEETLRKSEEQYKMLFTNMTEAFVLAEIICNDDGKPYDYCYLEINPAFELNTGVKREQVLDKYLIEVFGNADQLSLENLGEVALSGKSTHFEVFSQIANRYFEVYAFSPEKGKFAAIFRDITKRKKAEEALHYTSEQRKLALEIAQLGTWEYDVVSGLTLWDKKCGEVFGLGHERAFTQKEVLALVHPEDRQRVTKDIYAAIDPAGPGIYNTEYRIQLGDGTERWVAVYGRAFWGDEEQKKQPARFLGTLMDITERKKAEKILQESEQKYSTLFDQSAIGAVLFKLPEVIIVDINQALEKLTGFSKQEVIGKTTIELGISKPEARAELLAKFEKQGSLYDEEMHIFTKSGEELIVRANTNPLELNGHHYILCTMENITERKHMEVALNKSEQHLNDLITSIQDGLFELNREWQFTYINQCAAHNSGFKPDELVGENIWEKFPGIVRSSLESIYREVMETRIPAHLETNNLVSKKWLDISIYPSTLGILVFWRDITKNKQVEKALQKSEMSLRRLYESGMIGVFHYTLDDLITDANDKFLEMVGYTRKELYAGRINLEKITPPEYRSLDEYRIAELKTKGMNLPYEKVYIRKNGSRVPIIIGAATIDEARQEGIAFVLDITERKEAEKAAEKERTRLKNIIENIPVAVGETNAQGGVEVDNRVLESIWRGMYEMKSVSDYQEYKAWWPDTGERVKPEGWPAARALKGETSTATFNIEKFDGTRGTIIVFAKPILKKSGKVSSTIWFVQDITELKRAEEALKEAHDTLEVKIKERTAELSQAYGSLKESERRLAEAQEMAHLGNWEWNIITDKLYGSDEAYRILGVNPGGQEITYNEFLNYVHPDDQEYVDRASKEMLEGNKLDLEFRIISGSGEERIIHTKNEVIFDIKNNPILMRGTIQDITEHKQRESLRGAIGSINQIILSSLDFDEIMKRTVSEAAKVIGSETAAISLRNGERWILSYTYGFPEHVIGLEMSDEEEAHAVLAIKMKKPIAINDTYHDNRLNQNHIKKWGIRSVLVVPLITRGEAIGALFFNYHTFSFAFNETHIDFASQLALSISLALENSHLFGNLKLELAERKQAEENLVKMEKIRIKEIHHRIKNNLQVISSLLDLQKEKFFHLEICKTPEVIEAFLESQNRVASMALIHEELYKGDKIDTLDFAAYLRKLTADIFSSYSPVNKNISFNLNLEQVDLDLDTAIPLGIIVNELISNSFKHAFSAVGRGEIGVTLSKTKNFNSISKIPIPGNNCIKYSDFNYILKVSDNGRGVPEEIDFKTVNSLGLQLVDILVEQIDGCIELKKDQGTEFTIFFNDINEK